MLARCRCCCRHTLPSTQPPLTSRNYCDYYCVAAALLLLLRLLLLLLLLLQCELGNDWDSQCSRNQHFATFAVIPLSWERSKRYFFLQRARTIKTHKNPIQYTPIIITVIIVAVVVDDIDTDRVKEKTRKKSVRVASSILKSKEKERKKENISRRWHRRVLCIICIYIHFTILLKSINTLPRSEF